MVRSYIFLSFSALFTELPGGVSDISQEYLDTFYMMVEYSRQSITMYVAKPTSSPFGAYPSLTTS